jgi:hypothetical protein
MNIRPLAPELQKKAIEELNENPEHLQQNLQSLKEWLQENPQIKARKDDQFLINFLRGAKFKEEKCKKMIETFYRIRTKSPELIQNRDPINEKLSEISKLG